MVFRKRHWIVLALVSLAFIPWPSCQREDPRRTARTRLEAGEFREAVRALDKYVSANPRDVEARILLGRAYLGLDNYTDAHRHLQAALAVDPGASAALDWDSRTYRAEVRRLLDRGNLDRAKQILAQAIADLQTRIEGHPDPAILHQWMGNFELLRFNTRIRTIQNLLAETFDPSDVGQLSWRVYNFVLADRTNEESARAGLFDQLARNPSFGGAEAVEREMVGAKESFLATIASLERALTANPSLSTSAYALTAIYLQVGRLPEARKACEALLRIPAEGEYAATVREDQLQGHLAMADILQREGDELGAVAELRGVLESGMVGPEESLALLRRLCPLQANLRLWADLEATVERILAVEPMDTTGRMHDGVVAFFLKRDPWRTILVLKDFSPRLAAYFPLPFETLARAEIEVSDFPAAIETLNQLLREKPELRSARALRAETYRRIGWLDAAKEECAKLLAEKPTDTDVQETLREVSRDEILRGTPIIRTVEEGQEHLRRARNDHGARYQLVQLLIAAGRLDEATTEAETLASAFPRNFVPRVLLGEIRLLAGSSREAARDFRTARGLLPAIPDGLVGEARCSMREESWQDAIDRLRQATELAPRDRDILLLLARCEIGRGNPKGARAILGGGGGKASLKEIAPDDPAVGILSASIARTSGDRRSALRQFDRILDAMGDDADPGLVRQARLGRARCLADLGEPVDAKPELFHDGEAPPESGSIRDELDEEAVVFLFERDVKEGRIAEIFAILERALAGPPTLEAKLLAVLAGHLSTLGETEAAESACRRGLRILPDHPGLNRVLGRLAVERGNRELAIRCFGRTVRNEPADTETQLALASMLMDEGKSIQAIKALQRILKFEPEQLEAWQRMAFLIDPRLPGGVAHPKIAGTLRKMNRPGRPAPLVARLVAFRSLGGRDATPAAREAAFVTGAQWIYAENRIGRALAPIRSLPFVAPASAKGRRGRTAEFHDFSRAERRLLAAVLLSRHRTDEALDTIARMDPWEGPDDVTTLDLTILALLFLERGDTEAHSVVLDRLAEAGPEDTLAHRQRFWGLLDSGALEAARAWIPGHVPAGEVEFYRHLVRIQEEAAPGAFPLARTAARAELLRRFPLLWIDAAKEARDLAQNVPSSPIPYRIWADTLEVEGDARTAFEVLQESMERSPTDVPTVLATLEALSRKGGEKGAREASRIVQRGLEFNPRSPELLVASVECELRQDRSKEHLGEGIRTLRKALELLALQSDAPSETRARIHRRLGKLLESRQQWDEAERQFREALEIEPEEITNHKNLADLLLHRRRFDDAIDVATAMASAFPESPEGPMLRFRALRAVGRADEAAHELQSFLGTHPFHAPAYALSGDLLDDEGYATEALAWYRRATELDPGLWQVWQRMVRLRLAAVAEASPEARNAARLVALRDLEDCLAVIPGKADADRLAVVRDMLVLLGNLGRPEETVRLARTHAALLDRDPLALTLLGRAYVDLERIEDAERTLTKAIDLDDRNPRAHFYLGEAFRLRSADREARKEYQKALEIAVPFEEQDEAKHRLQGLPPTRRAADLRG